MRIFVFILLLLVALAVGKRMVDRAGRWVDAPPNDGVEEAIKAVAEMDAESQQESERNQKLLKATPAPGTPPP